MNYFRAILISLLLLLFNVGIAQNIQFNFADPQPEIMEVYGGDILSGDLDGDGDIDLIQSGIGENLMGQSARVSVFINDGSGSFTEKEQDFTNYFTTERLLLGDLDNDGDLDLIVTAFNATDFYRNDGQANFILENSTPFMPSEQGELIMGDIDGDGDNDVLQFGKLGQNPPFTTLYVNNGTGVFSIAQQTFTPLVLAQIAFIDIDNDADLDIISTGRSEGDEVLVMLYENDGNGFYTEKTDTQIEPLVAEEISVGDIDSDGDQDFLVTGTNAASLPSTAVYVNDGGQFSKLNDTPSQIYLQVVMPLLT